MSDGLIVTSWFCSEAFQVVVQYLCPESVTAFWLFVEIVVSGLLVVLAAVRLTTLADQFSDEWGLGKAFVGMLLLATVTSLPEVVSGATAGAIGAVDMAFGAVYGSCSFNIFIIVIMNFVFRTRGSVLREAGRTQYLNSSFGIVMITLSLGAIAVVQKFSGSQLAQQIVEVVAVLAIIAAYVLCMYLAQQFERRETIQSGEQAKQGRSLLLVVKILVVSVVTMASAWWLTQTGGVLAEHPIDLLGGKCLGATMVGICFLAVATSLPEIATSVKAVRIGKLDMALGNVFGSNMFNILVFPVVKITTLAVGDPLMMSGDDFNSNTNLLAGLLPILLTAVAVAGMVYRTERRFFRLGFDSFLLMVIYLLGMLVVVR